MKKHDIRFRLDKTTNRMIRINLQYFFNKINLRNSGFVKLNVSLFKDNLNNCLLQFKKIKKLIIPLYQYNYILSIKNLFLKLDNKMRINFEKRISVILPYILSYFDLKFDEQNVDLANFSLSIGLLSFISLLGFINIVCYLLANYLIYRYDVESKFSNYPRLKKLIKYYQKSNYVLIGFEIVFVILTLLFISVLCIGLFISLSI